MTLTLLAQAFEELHRLPFPKAVDVPGFTDWIADLAELDAFYAGLAVSRLEGSGKGKPLPLPSLSSLNKLEDNLKKLHGKPGISETLYSQCEHYLSFLKNLADRINTN